MHIFKNDFGYREAYRGSRKRESYSIYSHIHQFSEIIYVFSGNVKLTVDGVFYNLSAGEVAVITPFQVHEVQSVGAADFWMCVFSCSCVPDSSSEVEFFHNRPRSVFSASRSLSSQIDEMLSVCPHPILTKEEKIDRRIKAVLYSVFSEYVEAVPEILSIKKRDVLSSVLLYVNNHYLEKITLASVGRALGYNTKYLSQCLGAIPDMNFTTLLNSLRIDHAKRLLLSTDFKIIDIAYECGFESEQSFHRAFRRMSGMTPGEYRRKNTRKKA